VHFREALGFKRDDAQRVATETRLGAVLAQTRLAEQGLTRLVASVAPHAPYSTSAPLIQALAAGYEATRAVSSIHLAESPEELEFLATGTGPFRELLVDLGVWDESWVAPGLRPLAYLEQLDVLRRNLLVVHGTQLDSTELQRLAGSGATLVVCARSNRWVGVGVPPITAAFDAGVPLALGTDSLASVEDLNLFAELSFVRRLAPSLPASALLRAATLGGARALGLDGLGLLGPGATSRAVVRMPPAGTVDVEQWLVADAADTADLRWLDEVVAQALS
jgi:cytosine/adenosine deaminase-related metal-dependent hydrolase